MANRKKIKPEQLESTIGDILQGYSKEVAQEVREITADIGNQCRKDVESAIDAAGIGGTVYRKSIKLKVEKKNYIPAVTIWSPEHYRLTHLLENGHVVKAHGKVCGTSRAFPHWAQAEQTAVKNYEKKIKEAIKK